LTNYEARRIRRAMPAKPHLPRPTEAELDMLRVLWTHGPLTVREIHDALSEKETGYTTTLKILQKMTEKGLVRRDESSRSHVYRPVLKAEHTQRQLVRELMQRAFGGSAGQLVLSALSEQKATPAELTEIRRLLDEMETKR
jgi:BlaI family transcriptional regulator, penicillinase repressor